MSYFVKLPAEFGEVWVNPAQVLYAQHGDRESTYTTHSYVYLMDHSMLDIHLPLVDLLEKLAISNGERMRLNVQLGRDEYDGTS